LLLISFNPCNSSVVASRVSRWLPSAPQRRHWSAGRGELPAALGIGPPGIPERSNLAFGVCTVDPLPTRGPLGFPPSFSSSRSSKFNSSRPFDANTSYSDLATSRSAYHDVIFADSQQHAQATALRQSRHLFHDVDRFPPALSSCAKAPTDWGQLALPSVLYLNTLDSPAVPRWNFLAAPWPPPALSNPAARARVPHGSRLLSFSAWPFASANIPPGSNSVRRAST
jgi:hypothetical protein